MPAGFASTFDLFVRARTIISYSRSDRLPGVVPGGRGIRAYRKQAASGRRSPRARRKDGVFRIRRSMIPDQTIPYAEMVRPDRNNGMSRIWTPPGLQPPGFTFWQFDNSSSSVVYQASDSAASRCAAGRYGYQRNRSKSPRRPRKPWDIHGFPVPGCSTVLPLLPLRSVSGCNTRPTGSSWSIHDCRKAGTAPEYAPESFGCRSGLPDRP